MTTNTTNPNGHVSLERHITVPMSGDDYDICTPLLRRLAMAEVIHAFSYEETMTPEGALIYYMAKPEEERSQNENDDDGEMEGTSVA